MTPLVPAVALVEHLAFGEDEEFAERVAGYDDDVLARLLSCTRRASNMLLEEQRKRRSR